MPVIKRYSNRKLYDTDSKRYVTLEDLAEFVRLGEDVRVVDHVTGEDLTSVTLLQVVFEEEKKIGGLLPQIFLTRLIRTGGNTVSALRSRLINMDPFQTIDEEIRRRIRLLVDQAVVTAEEGQRWQELLLHRAAPQADVVHSTPGATVRVPVVGEDAPETGSVTVEPAPEPADSEELENLLRQVDALEQELARLKASGEAA